MSVSLTYTPELQQPEDGGDDDLWGLLLISIISAWDRHFGGLAQHDISAGDWTLDETEAQCGRIYITGNPSATRSVILPAIDRTYLVSNFSTAASGQVLLSCGAGGDIAIPNGCSQVITCYSVTGEINPISAPFGREGGTPDFIRRIGQGWNSPGMYFEGDGNVGFSRPAAGQVDLHLDTSQQGPGLRFFGSANGDLSESISGIAFRAAGGFATSVTVSEDGNIRFGTAGTQRALIGAGLAVGAANGPAGAGTVNADGYYRKGTLIPIARQYQRTGLSAAPNAYASFAHGQSSAPLHVFVRLDCVAPDRGYVAGDRVMVDGAGANACIIAGGNTTQVFYRVNDTFQLAGKTPALGAGGINPAAWNVVITGVWP